MESVIEFPPLLIERQLRDAFFCPIRCVMAVVDFKGIDKCGVQNRFLAFRMNQMTGYKGHGGDHILSSL
ncbi:hypothetical protein QPK87_24165 [Kamptonema cortianum]|nr:hypothetical protein [Kamptonema cortianum]